MKIKIACIQTASGENFEHNLKESIRLAREAHQKGAQIIAFPETFLFRGRPLAYSQIVKKTEQVLHKFQHIACMSRIPILLGSILEKSREAHRYFNTSLFISDHGHIISRYRKIHLFDVKTPGKFKVKESRYFVPGKSVVTADLWGIRFGFSICYDLRFPEQFRSLAKKSAEIIFVPSNFLYETGKAHWHVLLRARAIENQAFVVAPAQVGVHPGLQCKTFGHSLIIDPWGKILAEGSGSKSEVVVAEINLDLVKKLRRDFPVLKSASSFSR